MEFRRLVVPDSLQFVVIQHPGGDALVFIFVFRTGHTVPLSRDERADAAVFARLRLAADDEETGVVELGGGFPCQQDVPITRCSRKTDQVDRGARRSHAAEQHPQDQEDQPEVREARFSKGDIESGPHSGLE
jgi:hypothetical protein